MTIPHRQILCAPAMEQLRTPTITPPQMERCAFGEPMARKHEILAHFRRGAISSIVGHRILSLTLSVTWEGGTGRLSGEAVFLLKPSAPAPNLPTSELKYI